MTDSSRRRMMKMMGTAAAGGAAVILDPRPGRPASEQRPLLTRLGEMLRAKEIGVGEAMAAVIEAKLDVVDVGPNEFAMMNAGSKRSFEKWITRRARLTLDEACRVVVTREWGLVEFWESPGVSVTRFVDHPAPSAALAMMDRGDSTGFSWDDDADR